MTSYEASVKSYYDGMAKTMGTAKPTQIYFTRMEFVKKYISKNSVILDAGCGNGGYALPFAKIFKKIIAVDFSQNMLVELNKKIKLCDIHNISTKKANLLDLPFKSDFFDAIICFSSFYNIKNSNQLLHEFNRVLKINGALIFDAALAHSIGAFYFKKRFKVSQFFSHRHELLSILHKNNFDIVDRHYFEVIPKVNIPGLVKILDKIVLGKTIDEHISNLPLLKNFASRELLVCKRMR